MFKLVTNLFFNVLLIEPKSTITKLWQFHRNSAVVGMRNSFETCSSLWATGWNRFTIWINFIDSGEQRHKSLFLGFFKNVFLETQLTTKEFQGVKQQLCIFLKCVAQGLRCRQQHAVRGTDGFCDCWNPAVTMMCQRGIDTGPILFTNALRVLWAGPCLAKRQQPLTMTLTCDWSFSPFTDFPLFWNQMKLLCFKPRMRNRNWIISWNVNCC